MLIAHDFVTPVLRQRYFVATAAPPSENHATVGRPNHPRRTERTAMAYSRMSALACALPLVALVLASLCLNASAELAVPKAASSALAAAMSGDLAQLDATNALCDDAATRRILDDDDDDDDEDKEKKKKDEKKKEDKKKEDKKSKKSPPTPSPSAPTTPNKKGGKKTPPTPTTPATPGKPATSGKPGTPGAGKPAVKLSGSDSKVLSLLDAAAVDVDSAKAKLSVKTYVKSLTDTAAALRNAAILIRTGQRTLVAGQIDNSIATINGVSIMLPAGGADKSLLASALGKAQSAKAAWKA
ncbi:unnamed protein product [Closterium sp. NIES-64]|nr:unnamed protein product [Closterium sp. NIES-64]